MSILPRRCGTAALGAAATAMLATGVAQAAAPRIYEVHPSVMNPRTSTEVYFSAYGYDPDGKSNQVGWDFAGGTAFSELVEAPGAKSHTFGSDGVHWISVRMRDADGEAADQRFPFATHPDNWAPVVEVESDDHAITRVDADGKFPFGQRVAAWLLHDDSPKSGYKYEWDLNGDGTFGDGDPIDPADPTKFPNQRYANFTTDGTHPIKVRVTDGQGGETIAAGSVRTHTANEAPFVYYAPYMTEFTRAGLESEYGGHFGVDAGDDYTSWSDLTFAWKLDGQAVAGATGDSFELPSNLAAGKHTVVVTITDDGAGMDGPGGTPKSRTESYEIEVVESDVTHADELYASSALEHSATPAFRTLENISLYASVAHTKNPTGYAWDLDNDGQFDDSTGTSTYFAAANKGTYKVAVQVALESGGPVKLERTIVIDRGQDYAPVTNPTPNPNPGGGTTTPALTPEQVKAAMTAFLSKETAQLLTLITGANKKGIDQRKAILVIGTLSPGELPNGGTGRFDVYDKAAGKKLARAAAARRKLLGSTSVTLAKGQSKKVQVKLNRKGKSLLKKKGKVKLTVDATLTDALTGAQAKQSRTYTFKVKKKKR